MVYRDGNAALRMTSKEAQCESALIVPRKYKTKPLNAGIADRACKVQPGLEKGYFDLEQTESYPEFAEEWEATSDATQP